MKLKQLFIFSMLALCGVALTSCDDEKQDIIDDVNITDEQHVANILCDTHFDGFQEWVADCVPAVVPEGSYEEVNRFMIDESYVGWDFKFDRTGAFSLYIPADMFDQHRFVQGTWCVAGNHLELTGSLKDGQAFMLDGVLEVCIANYIKIKATCTLWAEERYVEFWRNVNNYQNQLYNPDFNVILYSTPEEEKYKWTLAGVTMSAGCDKLLQNPQTTYISPVTGETMMLTKPVKLAFNKNGEYEFDGLGEYAVCNGNWKLTDKKLELTFVVDDPLMPGKTKKEKLLEGTIIFMKSNYLLVEAKSKVLFEDNGENNHILEFPFNLPNFDIDN